MTRQSSTSVNLACPWRVVVRLLPGDGVSMKGQAEPGGSTWSLGAAGKQGAALHLSGVQLTHLCVFNEFNLLFLGETEMSYSRITGCICWLQ